MSYPIIASQEVHHDQSREEHVVDSPRVPGEPRAGLPRRRRLAGLAVPRVHAAEDNTIQVALVGCGGRGTGAAANALSVKQGPIKLVAMADVFENRLQEQLRQPEDGSSPTRSTCPQDRQFVGFDAYKKAMDCLKPGDIVIFATPPAFRWVHFAYAIEKGLNVFMEKPVTVDGPTSRADAEAGRGGGREEPQGRRRPDVAPQPGLQELAKRIQDGEIGDIILMRGYRMHGPVGFFRSLPKPGRHQRTDVPDPALPQLPLGQRRQASATSTSTSSTTAAG